VTLVLAGFTLVGWLDLDWTGTLLALPLLFLAWLTLNPLHHLAEGTRLIPVNGKISIHLAAAFGLFVPMILISVPIDDRLLQRRCRVSSSLESEQLALDAA
jgi:lipooligosaccharide transport system permease protein